MKALILFLAAIKCCIASELVPAHLAWDWDGVTEDYKIISGNEIWYVYGVREISLNLAPGDYSFRVVGVNVLGEGEPSDPLAGTLIGLRLESSNNFKDYATERGLSIFTSALKQSYRMQINP